MRLTSGQQRLGKWAAHAAAVATAAAANRQVATCRCTNSAARWHTPAGRSAAVAAAACKVAGNRLAAACQGSGCS